MPLYAITDKNETPERVCNLVRGDTPPELHGDFGVYDVSGVPGITENWIKSTIGTFVAPPQSPLTDEIRTGLKGNIDRVAESARMKFITPGAGQAAVYLAKQAEATAVGNDASPSADKYPLLAASVGVETDPTTGKPCADITAVATLVSRTASAWAVIAAEIEGKRLRSKAAVDAAQTFSDAMAASQVDWPSPGVST